MPRNLERVSLFVGQPLPARTTQADRRARTSTGLHLIGEILQTRWSILYASPTHLHPPPARSYRKYTGTVWSIWERFQRNPRQRSEWRGVVVRNEKQSVGLVYFSGRVSRGDVAVG
jgi:hypothetical protein